VITLAALFGCGAPTTPPPNRHVVPQQSSVAPVTTTARAASCNTLPARASSKPSASACTNVGRFDLTEEISDVALPAGRWVVSVDAGAKSYVSIGVSGPRDALVSFEVLSRQLTRLRTGTLEGDKRLPTFVSFATRKPRNVLVVVDAKEPVHVVRAESKQYTPPKKEKGINPYNHPVSTGPLNLVGLPFPIERKAGYLLQAPHRYHFARADVATALRLAFKQTRVRFKSNDIAVGDISQWNGIRPATDLGRARHISHSGGRDVDVGLPVRKGESLLMKRCDGVLVENDVLKCAPGTVKGVDGMRLAYLLGLLIDGPTPGGRYVSKPERRPGPVAIVETIFTDQAYIDEIRKALPVLRKKKWIHDEAYSALAEEGLLRPSPWHVDHVHIRFSGEKAVVPKVLDFDARD
jgi:hypothetical protein